MTIIRRIVLLLLLIAGATSSATLLAQRRVTPVTPVNASDLTPKAKEKADTAKLHRKPDSVVKLTDDFGREYMVDTITGNEWVDTLAMQKPKKEAYLYPLLHAATFGVNVWDPLMRALGAKKGGVGFWAELSFHNRFNPVVEVGIGAANESPSGYNYHYHTAIAPYFKVGLNYNFLFRKNCDYQFLGGIRYGCSPYNFSVVGTTTNDYWQTSTEVDVPSTHFFTGYLEVLAGVRVKIVGPLSAGWMVMYHAVLHDSTSPYGQPSYIPGFGSRTAALSLQLSLIYVLPFHNIKPIHDTAK
jgi:hypothetical protein